MPGEHSTSPAWLVIFDRFLSSPPVVTGWPSWAFSESGEVCVWVWVSSMFMDSQRSHITCLWSWVYVCTCICVTETVQIFDTTIGRLMLTVNFSLRNKSLSPISLDVLPVGPVVFQSVGTSCFLLYARSLHVCDLGVFRVASPSWAQQLQTAKPFHCLPQ